MSDQDNNLQIGVSFKSDTSGAGPANSEIDAIKAKTAAANSDAAASTKKLGDSIEQTGDDVKIFNTHGREMHRLIHEMDREVPGLGLVLRAAFRPETIGIAAILFLLEQLHNRLKSAGQAAQEVAEATASVALAQAAAMDKAAQTAAGFVEAMKPMEQMNDHLLQQFKEQLHLLEEIIKQQEKLHGKGDEIPNEEKRRALLQKQMRELYNKEPAVASAIQQAQAGLAVEEGDPFAAAAAERAGKADMPKLIAARDAADKKFKSGWFTAGTQGAKDELARSQNALDQALEDQKAVAAHNEAIKQATAVLADAIAANASLAKAMVEYRQKIETADQDIRIHKQTRAAETFNAGGVKELIESVGANMDAGQHHQRLNQTQLGQNRQLEQLIMDEGDSKEAADRILNALAGNKRQQDATWKWLASQVEATMNQQ